MYAEENKKMTKQKAAKLYKAQKKKDPDTGKEWIRFQIKNCTRAQQKRIRESVDALKVELQKEFVAPKEAVEE